MKFPFDHAAATRFEPLERRTLLAQIVVATLADSGVGSLRQAIETASSGDTIDLTALSGTITLQNELTIDKSLTIDGPGQNVLAISGNDLVRVFNQTGGTVTMDGLTIRDGEAGNGFGGGYRIEGGSASFTGMSFQSNRASEGGAIAAIAFDGDTVSLSLVETSIVNNSATSDTYLATGGGICLYALDGTEEAPPGVLNFTMTRSTVASNIASGFVAALGGGLYARANHALDGYGGGQLNAQIDNSTVAANEARTTSSGITYARGGGLYFEARGAENVVANDSGMSVALRNTTVAKNSVQLGAASGSVAEGAGMFLDTVSTVATQIGLTLASNLFADNQNSQDLFGLAGSAIQTTDGGHNLIESVANFPGIVNGQNNNLVGVDAKLGSLGNHGGPTPTVKLLYGSPAIDAGPETGAPAADQRGISRFGLPDIGAYEWQNSAPLWPSVVLSSSRVGAAYNASVTASDVDLGQTLTLSLVDGPSFLTFQDNGDGTASLSGTPELADVGTLWVTLRVSDGLASTDVTLPLVVRNSLKVLTNSDTGPGSIRQAIADANAGDVIDLTGISGIISLATPLDVTQDLSFLGADSEAITISGGNLTRIFHLGGSQPAHISLMNITLAEGKAVSGGAVYLSENVHLTLNHVRITGSSASANGGAIASENASNSITLIDSYIDHNLAGERGGGIYAVGGLSLTRTTISHNSVIAQASDGAPTTSRGLGGGLYLGEGTHTFTNSTVAANTITTAQADTREALGGGIYLENGSLSITGVTVALNGVDVSTGGAGLHVANGFAPTLTLRNSLFAGNSGSVDVDAAGFDPASTVSSSLVGKMATSLLFTHGSQGNIVGSLQAPIDARLGELAMHGATVPTVRLRKGSPAINAASSEFASSQDQRGIARQGAPDIGAFEYVPPANIAPAWTTSQLTPAITSVPYSMLIGASDANPDETLTFSLLSGPSFLQLVDQGNGMATLSGTATLSHAGTHAIQIRVSDGTDTTTLYTTLLVSASLGEIENRTLFINGTNGNDTIEALLSNPTTIRVTRGSTVKEFALADVSRIIAYGFDGHDTMKIQINRLPTTIYGGAGNDTIRGGGGDDQLYGDAGHDYIDTGSGKNKAYGGSGNDTITGGNSADRLSGEDGDDRLNGRGGPDILYGNAGNDYIDTGSDRNRGNGGDGDDTLIGGNSNDRLAGDAGNDSLIGNRGKDNLSGGDGTDRARIDAGDILDSIEVTV